MDIWLNIKYNFWLLYITLLHFIDGYLISQLIKIVPRRYRFKRFKPILVSLFVIAGVSAQLFIFDSLTIGRPTPIPSVEALKQSMLSDTEKTNSSSKLKIPSEAEFRMNWIKNKLEKIAKHSQRWEIMKFLDEVEPLPQPTDKVHVFYNPFFENINVDGKWGMWDKEFVLNKIKNSTTPQSRELPTHNPPIDIASSFYPLLGCYSSKDPSVINTHFKQIRDTGIGVVVVLWLPQHQLLQREVLPLLLNAATKYHLKIALHIEAYNGQTVQDILETVKLVINNYSDHPSLYKLMKNNKNLPVFYVFESQRLTSAEWREFLAVEGERTIRETSYDAIFIGLLRDAQNRFEIQRSHFDGFYTYFASNAFTYGSTWKNWNTLAKFAEKHKMMFFPSVGPGYVDTNVRPWNAALTRHRARGHYYQRGEPLWRHTRMVCPSTPSTTGWKDPRLSLRDLPKTHTLHTWTMNQKGPTFI